jgi:BirA family biotin operon repressor/biotin-[acetyl-CoA-carboxylase] ligase
MPARILTVPETGSTNADLLALARDGHGQEGLWLRAERQTAGKGRQGRDWDSPVGNLYASTLVRVRPSDPPAATLALVTAVALEEVVRGVLPERRRAALTLKWPNDLLIAGVKMSGILLERAGDWVVIGTGVNIAYHPALPDRPTTCLHAEGAAVDVADFHARLAEMLAAWLHIWRTDDLAAVAARWRERAHAPGTPLVARLPDGSSVTGTFDTLADDGALLMRLADGSTRAIHAGDVFLI